MEIRIALDFDGVLAKTIHSWVRAYNYAYDKEITIDDLTEWNFEKKLGITEITKMQIFKGVWYNLFEVRPQEVLQSEKTSLLKTLGKLDIVSGIDIDYETKMKRWLLFNNIDYDGVLTSEKNKQNLNYNFYIDDNPELAESIRPIKNKYMMLYEQPWNRHVMTSANVFRVYSLDDAFNNISHIKWMMNRAEKPKVEVEEEVKKIEEQVDEDMDTDV